MSIYENYDAERVKHNKKSKKKSWLKNIKDKMITGDEKKTNLKRYGLHR